MRVTAASHPVEGRKKGQQISLQDIFLVDREATRWRVRLMGNTSSSQNRQTAQDPPNRSHSRRSRSQHLGTPSQSQQQSRSSSRASADVNISPDSPSSASQQQQQSQSSSQKRLPHKSLRQKKKSLELPDLALALTPAPSGAASSVSGGPYRRPQASAPIAIPSKNGAQTSTSSAAIAAAKAAYEYEQRLKANPPAEGTNSAQMLDLFNEPPARGRGNSLFRGAPIQYNSTRSFTGTSRGQPQFQSFGLRGAGTDQEQDDDEEGGGGGTFKAEDVHSSIPLALRHAEERGAGGTDDEAQGEESGLEEEKENGDGSAKGSAVGAPRKTSEEKQPVQVCIIWRGGGKSVILIRAGDNNWKGRQQMEYDESTKQWSTWVSLMPGTHHIRFLVDGSSKIAEDLPTAVDDNGTLANYVAVPISGHTPPSATLHPASRDALNQYQQQQKASGQQSTGTPLLGTAPAVPTPGNGVSFFADAEAAAGKEDGAWTDRVPWQLECAAEEEEQWLSYSHSPSHHGGMSGQGQGSHPPPPPQHPQAPSLPRHLEKLIMNQRMPSSRGSSSNSSGSKSASKSGSGSGAGSGGNAALSVGELPVTTASGTNLSASTSGGGALGMTSSGSNSYGGYGTSTSTHERAYGGIGMGGLADDNSVLPVPSHVVLHHLGTSAIRNGVLAVADTVRYKKKYITTIYYKPT
ncbi:carbohydrate-binding module family 48 [Pyrrhoderma noxium]|uniref:Carbohydrate-binding module family 48 n=1 Tax=Pyrrhoderma noxium TaxID=2282107 RepID=A0A286UCE8_9AGAM|nr:carbohydrate-binding module family 48 [Pyrrhoderma noxium]